MEVNRSKHWTKGLPLVTHAMNLSVSRVTNYTPYELVFNQKPRSHYALLDEFDDNVIVAEEDLDIDFEEGSYSIQISDDTDNVTEGVEAEKNNRQSDSEVLIIKLLILIKKFVLICYFCYYFIKLW